MGFLSGILKVGFVKKMALVICSKFSKSTFWAMFEKACSVWHLVKPYKTESVRHCFFLTLAMSDPPQQSSIWQLFLAWLVGKGLGWADGMFVASKFVWFPRLVKIGTKNM